VLGRRGWQDAEQEGKAARQPRKVVIMGDRACAWMSGPAGPNFRVPALKWWLALSRGKLVTGYRCRPRSRPPVTCATTPSFISPLDRSK
jgi:hypothetical protein